jgi:hypothetical protein
MKRKLLSLFLLLVVAFQLLPVKEIGSLFAKDMLTEEVCDSLENAEEHKDHQTAKKSTEDDLFSKSISDPTFYNDLSIAHLEFEIFFSSRITDDTLTPPPLV